MRRGFVTLDVFTDRRLAGNPLAVVLDSEELDTAAMQAIAREFNHPETVFVVPPADAAHRARVRIFTPARDLPFAGHPTVGTAVLLGLRPEHMTRAHGTPAEGHVSYDATIELVHPTGSRSYATFRLAGEPVMAELQAHDVSRPGEKIAIAHDGSTYGQGLAEQVKELLNLRGVREAAFV